jgi:hypothetical protein
MTDQQASQQPAAEALRSRMVAVEAQKGPQPKRQLPQLGEERSRVLLECPSRQMPAQARQRAYRPHVASLLPSQRLSSERAPQMAPQLAPPTSMGY